MSRAKSVKNEDVAIRSESLGDLGIVLLLALVEADVLEHEDLARLKSGNGVSGLLAIGVVNKGDVETGELGELGGNRSERELGLGAVALGTTKVAHEDNAGVVLDKVLNGGQSSDDTGGIANDAVLQRHVEVNAARKRACRRPRRREQSSW